MERSRTVEKQVINGIELYQVADEVVVAPSEVTAVERTRTCKTGYKWCCSG